MEQKINVTKQNHPKYRQMTDEEIFESAVEYFQVNESFFDDLKFEFLTSILSYESDISKKQKQAFVRLVKVIQLCEQRRLRRDKA